MALGKARREGREPTLVCINQLRSKIGVMYGDPETMPGGRAFKYASSLTIRFYGKDVMETAVSKTLPAYKEIAINIKKHKVPILATKAIAQLALLPIPEYKLQIGDAYDWNTLLAYLKSMELLTKVSTKKGGWQFVNPETGESSIFKKQDDLKFQIYDDPEFGQQVKSGLISVMMKTTEVIE
jgi:RecA/RadA recombinase